MDEVNVYGDEWTDGTDEPGFRNRERPLGETLGAQKIGGTIYLIEPGQRICPYHWHFGEEEWMLVLEGTVTLGRRRRARARARRCGRVSDRPRRRARRSLQRGKRRAC